MTTTTERERWQRQLATVMRNRQAMRGWRTPATKLADELQAAGATALARQLREAVQLGGRTSQTATVERMLRQLAADLQAAL